MLEKDIENLIAQHPDEFFPREGFRLIQQQYVVNRRRFDVLFEDRFGRSIIVEVKRGILTREASGQVMEYYGLLKSQDNLANVELVLFANVIPPERRRFLETAGISCKEVGIRMLVEVAEKHGYDFLEREHSQASGEVPKRDKKPMSAQGATTCWMFQANPAKYDVLNALADSEIGDTIHWQVNQYKNEISEGHVGLIWMSGKDSGVYAVTKIVSNPGICVEPKAEQKYWLDSGSSNKPQYRVKLQILTRLVHRPLFKSQISSLEGLDSLRILRYAQGTNFPVKPEEWSVLRDAIDRHMKRG